MEKNQTADKMRAAPKTNCRPRGVAKSNMDKADDKTTDTPVAKPFSTLSAYLMTAATSKPPPACNKNRVHVQPLKPCK